MPKTRIIGDIHGHLYDYHMLTNNLEYNSVQVGDFGIGFNGQYWEDRVNDHHNSGRHRFIRGNHDSPDLCKMQMVGYIPDGTVENDVMYIGGAWSIDHAHRISGIDWWHDEQCSDQQFDRFIEAYSVKKPRVMITHDCPTLAAYYMFVKEGKSLAGRSMYLTRTGEALQEMFELHQPEEWYFGHWHNTKKMKINGTTFQCLGIDDYIDVEL